MYLSSLYIEIITLNKTRCQYARVAIIIKYYKLKLKHAVFRSSWPHLIEATAVDYGVLLALFATSRAMSRPGRVAQARCTGI